MQQQTAARLAQARKGVVAMIILTTFFLMMASGCFSDRPDGLTEVPDDCIPANLQGQTVVAIKNYAFVDDTLTIARGTTVTWVNCDNDTHTSTSDSGVWSSAIFTKGQTYARPFASAGTFPYHCAPHPSMRAVIIVQ